MSSFPDPTLLAIPAFAGLVALEWWAVKTGRAKGRYTTPDAIVSMFMGLGSVFAGLLFGFITWTALMWAWDHRVATLPVTWWSLALAFVVNDFFYYWKHRLMHRSRWFWAVHVVHHSSTHYNLSTALRQTWTSDLALLNLIGLPMAFFGLHPGVIAFVAGLNLLYQFWIHTEAIDRFPRWFEYIFNTPSHHRVHHARNPRYLDANHAGTLIIWDRMFGTFVPENPEEKCDYGLVKNISTYNPLIIAFHEFGALGRDLWRDGLRPQRWLLRLIRPPGWSPDGEHNDSARLKAEFVAANPHLAGTPGLPAVRQKPSPDQGVTAHGQT